MKIALSDHFTYGKLLRFTMPSIIMMVFTSIYSIVDGYFVSNFAGQTALGAVNLVFPIISLLASMGFMLGSGGSALIAKTLGEGNSERAQKLFSMFVYAIAAISVVTSIIGYFLMPAVVKLIGGEGELLELSLRYANIMLMGLVPFALQLAFQIFFITAGRPQTGLYVIVGAGLTNIVLDILFVGVLRGGIAGAAWASVLSQCVGGLLPLWYFARRNNPSTLRLGRPALEGRALGRGASNGLSELISSISSSVVVTLFNAQLLRIAGEAGVAAYSVLMYVNFVFVAIYIGYATGVQPVVGYAYGAGDRPELRSLLRKSLVIIAFMAAAMVTLAELGGDAISRLFVGYDEDLLAMTKRGFDIYSLSYLLSGVPIFTSAYFTGLNNGPVSAIVSGSRTLVFQVGSVIILPQILGLDGIWLSVVVAEILASVVAAILLFVFRRKYGYGGPVQPAVHAQ